MSQSFLQPKNALSLYAGESKTLKVTVQKPDPEVRGGKIPVVLTGTSMTMTVRDRLGGSILFRKTTALPSEIEISDPNGGIARIFITPGDTAALPTGRVFVYDIVLTLAGGERYYIQKPSDFSVLPVVTAL